jgi:DNA-binding NtrC family response regulator
LKDLILIVDDEPDMIQGLKRLLAYEIDARIEEAADGIQALEYIRQEPVDLLLTDIRMPHMDGMELLRRALEMDPMLTVVMMTAYGTIETAVQAIKMGAYDFIKKPFTDEKVLHVVRKALERNRLIRENLNLQRAVGGQHGLVGLVGRSEPMQQVFQCIRMVAPTDLTVLIIGESGTGKDLAARAIHALSRRSKFPLVTVNCPTLPEQILESELFGYRRGAFTDAREDKEGLFQAAHRGTIFLDEIGDIAPSVQTKLLRVLQEKEIKPLGDSRSYRVDVRIIASTNQDLEEKIARGQFREDLYYRLNVVTLRMPPLREIREDIPLLAHHFLKAATTSLGTGFKHLSEEAMAYLLSQPWKGNARELQNTIHRACALCSGEVIEVKDLLPLDKRGQEPVVDLPSGDAFLPYKEAKARCLEEFTRSYLAKVLRQARGNVSEAARRSGIERQSLQKILRRYGIRARDYRPTPT